MKVEKLTTEKLEQFVQFCKKYKSELDESFLYDEDLEAFLPSDENPTYIVVNKKGKLIAAASLILDEYAKRGRKGRFRIFYSEVMNSAIYQMLLQEILMHVKELDKIYVFVPIVNQALEKAMSDIKFKAERYAFLLVREDEEVPEYYFSSDYELRMFRLGHDEADWCEVRNAGFANLKGSETPMTPEMITKTMSEKGYIEEATLILYHNGRPVGVIRGSDDEYENEPIMDIGPIAIIPEYQGRGLGRNLLRKMLKIAKDKGYKRTILSVNAENEHAKSLYIQEGFTQVEAVACYEYKLIN